MSSLPFVACAPVGQLEADDGEEHALEVLQLPARDLETELGHEHPLEGIEEAPARGVGPVIRGGVQIVAEEDLVRVDDLVEVLFCLYSYLLMLGKTTPQFTGILTLP